MRLDDYILKCYREKPDHSQQKEFIPIEEYTKDFHPDDKEVLDTILSEFKSRCHLNDVYDPQEEPSYYLDKQFDYINYYAEFSVYVGKSEPYDFVLSPKKVECIKSCISQWLDFGEHPFEISISYKGISSEEETEPPMYWGRPLDTYYYYSFFIVLKVNRYSD